MYSDNPTIRAEISGTEHTPEHANENARAFVEMGQAVADAFGADYEELRITDKDHYFLVEEEGDLNDYTIMKDPSEIDYSAVDEVNGKDHEWVRSMDLSEFENAIDSISESEATLHGVSRARGYRKESSTPPGMMESFGGPKKVPVSYGDAIMPMTTENGDVNVLLYGAPNSGAMVENSFFEVASAKARSLLSDKDTNEIIIEDNQSGEEPYAKLSFIEGSEYEDGMGKVIDSKLEEVAEYISGFEAEII